MSRIGKQKIVIPDGVEVSIEKMTVRVKGPKGELVQKIKPQIEVSVDDGRVVLTVRKTGKTTSSLWGLYRSLIANMIWGVTKGWNKGLELVGVGYRVAQKGVKLIFSIGFSHPVEFDLPEGIEAKIKGGKIDISGVDKQLVGEVAARIRKIRPPEPYKGKGIRYIGEVVRKKPGKAAKALGTGVQ